MVEARRPNPFLPIDLYFDKQSGTMSAFPGRGCFKVARLKPICTLRSVELTLSQTDEKTDLSRAHKLRSREKILVQSSAVKA